MFDDTFKKLFDDNCLIIDENGNKKLNALGGFIIAFGCYYLCDYFIKELFNEKGKEK